MHQVDPEAIGLYIVFGVIVFLAMCLKFVCHQCEKSYRYRMELSRRIGRHVYEGERGGFYYRTNSGRRVYV